MMAFIQKTKDVKEKEKTFSNISDLRDKYFGAKERFEAKKKEADAFRQKLNEEAAAEKASDDADRKNKEQTQ